MADQAVIRPLGRPRALGGDEAIIGATLELLAEVGLQGTTMRAIAERANVARATIYLRWPTRDALITAAVKVAMGGRPFTMTGDLAEDLRLGADRARKVFSQPGFQAVLPEIIRTFLSNEPAATYDILAPNRRRIAEEYARLAETSGFRVDIDPAVVVDLLIGGHLNHLLATGRAPSEKLSHQMFEVLIAGLRAKPEKRQRQPRRA
jgi:AcrR family transcriptional regulator